YVVDQRSERPFRIALPRIEGTKLHRRQAESGTQTDVIRLMKLRRDTRGALHRALCLEIAACGHALAGFVQSPRQTFEHVVCRRSARELRNVVDASGEIGRPKT